MLTCFIILIIASISLVLQDRYKIKGIDNRYFLLLIEVIIMIFSSNNPDYKVYERAYLTGEGPYYERGISVIAKLLGQIGIYEYNIFLLLVMFLIFFVFCKWGKSILYINHTIFLYSLFVMYYDCIQIRNTIASFLILYAIYLCITEKKVLCFFICIIAVFFHRFAIGTGLIVFYLMLIKPKKNYEISKREVGIIVIGAIMITIFAKNIIAFVSNENSILHRVSLYVSDTIGYDSLLIWAGFAIVMLVMLWYFGVKKVLSKDNIIISETKKRMVNILYRYALFSIPCAGILLFVEEFNRIYRMFYLVIYLLYGLIIPEMSRKNRYIFFSMVSIINILFMSVATYRGVNFDLFW